MENLIKEHRSVNRYDVYFYETQKKLTVIARDTVTAKERGLREYKRITGKDYSGRISAWINDPWLASDKAMGM